MLDSPPKFTGIVKSVRRKRQSGPKGGKQGPVRMNDLDANRKLVAEWARTLMTHELCTLNAFPSTTVAEDMARECILQAVTQKKVAQTKEEQQGNTLLGSSFESISMFSPSLRFCQRPRYQTIGKNIIFA